MCSSSSLALHNDNIHVIMFTARDWALSDIMCKLESQNLPVWTPIQLSLKDSPVVLRLKSLLAAMLDPNPTSRLTAEVVTATLENIKGWFVVIIL